MDFYLTITPLANPLTPGEFLDIEFAGRTLQVSKQGTTLGELEAGEMERFFELRKRLKAVVVGVGEQTQLTLIRWADLHRHSGYSLLDGASHIKDIVAKTEYVGALTDHGNMFGFLDYYKQMKEAGKKPIVGFEAYAETIDGQKGANHLILLAKNYEGFMNLVKLVSLANGNIYYKPHVSYQMLREHSKGIIASSACIAGEIPRRLLKNDYEGAKKVLHEISSIFEPGDFYLEIQRHGLEDEKILNPLLIKLAKETGTKLIATTDSHYVNEEDSYSHEILLCLQTGTEITDPNHFKFSGSGYHLHTADEIEYLFRDIPEVLDNTLEIAEKCNLEIPLGELHMPVFEVPEGFTQDTYFEHLCWNGFKKRYEGKPEFESEEYLERMKYEIKTIQGMGFSGYFLIVWDYVRFAKDEGIMVGPGRGSCVGSLASFCLEITDLDPIPVGLLFERFLNTERISMPDIDLDFEDERRGEVIEYVRQKYGIDSVSKIVTFGTLAAKGAPKDVARVMGFPYEFGNRISKAIPDEPKMTIKKAFEKSPEFKAMYENEPDVKKVVDIAMKLEGLPRHVSQHACGVIIAPSKVSNYVPQVLLEDKVTKTKEWTAALSMSELEEMGLLKMDFLGLRNMGVIGNTLEEVNGERAKRGEDPINYLNIPLDDKKVYEYIATGDTFGIFQLESGGMRQFMKDLFSDARDIDAKDAFQLFERLVAGISLYRPGPMDSIPDYIKNMRSPEYVTYDTPLLKPILGNTYGKVVYQEQVMRIVQDLAGYSLGRADLVRRAMGKKKKKVMEAEENNFIHGIVKKDGTIDVPGCVRNDISEEIAKKIWDIMAKFAEYAFNKSHAAGYAVISNATAWLKYYYPVQFMASTLNSVINKSDKLKVYLSVCKKMGIEILPPDVNESKVKFSTENGGIRFGLKGIRNLGKIADQIVEERESGGKFKGYQDFAERMAIHHKVDKKILEALVYSGAVDSFPKSRHAKISILGKILDSASLDRKDAMSGQINMFALVDDWAEFKIIEIPDEEEFAKKLKLEKEKEYAGLYVTEHPLDDYQDYLVKEGVAEIGFIIGDDDGDDDGEEIDEVVARSNDYDGKEVKLAGVVKDLKLRMTKKDAKIMYTFTLEDRTGEMSGVVFTDKVEKNLDKLVEGKVVLVQGKISVSDGWGTQIMIDNMFDIESITQKEKPQRIWLKAVREEQFDKLKQFIANNPGEVPVYVKFGGRQYEMKNKIQLNLSVMAKLQETFGAFIQVVY